jgi:hypothetical protein
MVGKEDKQTQGPKNNQNSAKLDKTKENNQQNKNLETALS